MPLCIFHLNVDNSGNIIPYHPWIHIIIYIYIPNIHTTQGFWGVASFQRHCQWTNLGSLQCYTATSLRNMAVASSRCLRKPHGIPLDIQGAECPALCIAPHLFKSAIFGAAAQVFQVLNSVESAWGLYGLWMQLDGKTMGCRWQPSRSHWKCPNAPFTWKSRKYPNVETCRITGFQYLQHSFTSETLL